MAVRQLYYHGIMVLRFYVHVWGVTFFIGDVDQPTLWEAPLVFWLCVVHVVLKESSPWGPARTSCLYF
jgi:hypothetical protein